MLRISLVGLLAAVSGCAGLIKGGARGEGRPAEPQPKPTPPWVWWALPDGADVPARGGAPPFNTVWKQTSGGGQITLVGSPGETVAVQMVVSAESGPRQGVGVSAGDLLAEPGQTAGRVPAQAVSIFAGQWQTIDSPALWAGLETGRLPGPVDVCDRLRPMLGPETVDLDGRRHQMFWIEVAIPSQTVAGRYRGEIALADPANPGLVVALELEVRSLVLAIGPGSLPVIGHVRLGPLLREVCGYRGALPVRAQRLMASGADGADSLAQGRAALAEIVTLGREHGLRIMVDDLRPEVEFAWPGVAQVRWASYDACLSEWIGYGRREPRPGQTPRPCEPLAAPVGLDWPDPGILSRGSVPPPGAGSGLAAGDGRDLYHRTLAHYGGQVAEHLGQQGQRGRAVVMAVPARGHVVGLADAESDPWVRGTAASEIFQVSRLVGILAEARTPLGAVVGYAPGELDRTIAAGGNQAGPAAVVKASTAAGGIWLANPDKLDAADLPRGHDKALRGPRSPVWLNAAAARPPYWPSARPECPPVGVVAWGWAAWRYGLEALDVGLLNPWGDSWANGPRGEFSPAGRDGHGNRPVPWVYVDCPREDGHPRGRLWPSRRLKLLRRAIADTELLELAIERLGPEPVKRLARVAVGYALHEAAQTPQRPARFGGWSLDADLYEQLRRALGQALDASLTAQPPAEGDGRTGEHREPVLPDSWRKLLARAERVELTVIGVDTPPVKGDGPPSEELVVRVELSNRGAEDIGSDDLGLLSLADLPLGWQAVPRAVRPGDLAAGQTTTLTLRAVPEGGASRRWEVSPDALPLALVWNQAGQTRRTPLTLARHTVRGVSQPPVVDGDLRDWTGLPDNIAEGFGCLHRRRQQGSLVSRQPAQRETLVRAVADDHSLYLAFECACQTGDDQFSYWDNRPRRFGGAVFGEEALEIVVVPDRTDPANDSPEPQRGRRRAYRLAIKRQGAIQATMGWLCECRPGEGCGGVSEDPQPWPAEIAVACSAADPAASAWYAEVAIPWAALGGRPASGSRWLVNYARHARAVGQTTAWSGGAAGHIGRLDTMGRLVLP